MCVCYFGCCRQIVLEVILVDFGYRGCIRNCLRRDKRLSPMPCEEYLNFMPTLIGPGQHRSEVLCEAKSIWSECIQ